MCAQSSQRATWPPRAAVRQFSMALITFSWPRLTWPALASTPGGPVVAEDVRDLESRTGHECRPLRRRLNSVERQRRQPVERADDRADRVGGDAGVERGGIELGVPQERLDHADVDILLEQVRGEAVPSVCGVTRFLIPAIWAAACTARLSWRGVR